MEKTQPEAVCASGKDVVRLNEGKTAFTATKKEKLTALATYVLAWVYIRKLFFYGLNETGIWERVLLTGFTLGFLALGEYLHHDKSRSGESWVWLTCVMVLTASVVFERCHAWSDDNSSDRLFYAFFFMHIFAVWWVLSRSGTLLEGKSGMMLPLDALDGFIIFPFGEFFLRLKTVIYSVVSSGKRTAFEKPEKKTTVWTAVISFAAMCLLVLSVCLLRSADHGFKAMTEGIADLFRFRWNGDLQKYSIDFLLSLPVGAYLFGLLDGSLRQDRSYLRQRAERIRSQTALMKTVSMSVWRVLLGLFCALYALFFTVQGRYLFGAFTRTLPEGFIVSQYARQGFFELCGVMAVNFALLLLARLTARGGLQKRAVLLLLCETLLLAVVAFSKLALYIDCFGFTPKRLQSTWLVLVLAFGCLCCVYSLITGKKSFRGWMYFGAISLSALCLY